MCKKISIKWFICFVIMMVLFLFSSLSVRAVGRLVVYRVYNPNSGEHFYTENINEKNNLIRCGWRNEDVGWTAPEKGQAVYRLYNTNGGEHHYTTDTRERTELIRLGWKDEGISWYSGGNAAIYRVYNPGSFANNHHFTINVSEIRSLVSKGWHDEKIAWYGNSVTTGDRVIAVARTQIGYREGKNNYTKYGVWYAKAMGYKGANYTMFSHGAWCAMFVSWCGNQAGLSNSRWYYYAYTPDGVAEYQKRRCWHWKNGYTPKSADLVFYDWNNDKVVDHVGLVENNNNGTITTIEGNYQDQVKRRVINANSQFIFGYASPVD